MPVARPTGGSLDLPRFFEQFFLIARAARSLFIKSVQQIAGRKSDAAPVGGPDRSRARRLAEREPRTDSTREVERPDISRQIDESIADRCPRSVRGEGNELFGTELPERTYGLSLPVEPGELIARCLGAGTIRKSV